MLPSIFDAAREKNPFEMPRDEKIFTFKEEERERRLEERKKNSKLKIWEKNRPAREGCLRRLLEKEIEPTGIAINPSIKKKITVAEAASAAIPHERAKNKENRFKVVEKKREMFLVQMMLDIKKKEIQKLEEYALLREDGLNYSEKMLDKDLKEFTQFLEKNKESRHDAQKQAEIATQKKNKCANKIKQLQESQGGISSDMGKNLETLNNCFKYKQFLDSLAPKDIQEEYKETRLHKSRLILEKKDTESKTRLDIQPGPSHQSSNAPGPTNNRNIRTPLTEKKKKKKEKEEYAFGGPDPISYHIDPELQQIIEDSDDDFPMYIFYK
jgi:hypothetical protein